MDMLLCCCKAGTLERSNFSEDPELPPLSIGPGWTNHIAGNPRAALCSQLGRFILEKWCFENEVYGFNGLTRRSQSTISEA